MEHPVKEIRSVIRSITQGTPDQQRGAVYRYFTPGASFEHPFCRVPSINNVNIPGLGELDSRAVIVAILKWYRILSPKIDLEIESCVLDQRTNLLYVRVRQVFSIWFVPFHRANVRLVTVLHLDPRTSAGGGGGADAADDERASPSPPPSPEPYDAAQEKLHAVQEGSAPSYAAVASGEAAPVPAGGHSRTASASSSAPGAGAGGPKPITRYYIKKQEDLYQVNEFLKFVSMTPGATVCAGMQLFATLFCLVAAMLLRPFVRAAWPLSAGAEKGKEK